MPSESPSSMPSESPSESPSAQPSESPSSNPSRSCENLRTDCGWGIFNPWTCQCECAIGFCFDHNQQCYEPCDGTIDRNPFGGCIPGWDCPWFANERSGLCETKSDLVNEHLIYRTAKECCEVNFAGSSSCEYDSMAVWGHPSNAAYPPWAPSSHASVNSNPQMFFPDLSDNNNCVRGNNYESWMAEEGFSDFYLFADGSDCCKMW